MRVESRRATLDAVIIEILCESSTYKLACTVNLNALQLALELQSLDKKVGKRKVMDVDDSYKTEETRRDDEKACLNPLF